MSLRFPSQQLARFLGTLLIITLSLTGIVLLQKSRIQVDQATLTAEEYQEQEKQEKVKLDILKKFPALGFNNLLADWIYLRFIQYFGDGKARGYTGYSLSPDYFELIVDRDPRFVNAQLKLSVATSLFAGEAPKTVAYLAQSLKVIPPKLISPSYPPYYLWVYKGIDELLFLGNIEAAKHANMMAAKWAEMYPDEASQNLAARMRETVKFLENNPRSKVAQIGAWSQVLSGAADAKTQERALAEIKALGGEIIVTPDGRLSVRVPPGIN